MLRFLLIGVFLLAACAPQLSDQNILETYTAQTAPIEAAVNATVTAEVAAIRTPQLVVPEDGAVFENPLDVNLSWNWIRALNEGEAYDVRIWREGAPHYGITWTQENTINLAQWLSAQQPGDYFWSVAVVRGENGEVSESLSVEAAPRKFTVNSTIIPTPAPTPTPGLFPVEDIIIQLPEGFQAEVYADMRRAITAITVFLFGPDDAGYALTLDGNLWKLEDQDGDNYAETITALFLNSEHGSPFGHAVGLAFRDGVIYISDKGRISTLTDEDGDGQLETVTPLVEELPAEIFPLHSNNGIVFGPDDKLYVGVGAASDAGPITRRYEASILRMNPDGSDLEVFATGFRNPYDLAFSPQGELFTADNSPDRLTHELTYLPPEELNYVREGLNYGFPEVFGNPPPGIEGVEPPVTELITSTVSSGLVYYSADQFPPAYSDGVYVVQYGGMLRGGHQVIFVTLERQDDGRITGTWETFAAFNKSFHPVDVTVGPDGSLYVVEWTQGTIYRITYGGA